MHQNIPPKRNKKPQAKQTNKQKAHREIEKELKSKEIEKELKCKGRRTVVTFTCFPVSSSGLISIQSLFFLNQVGILKGLFRECCVQAKEGHACFFSKVSLFWPLLRNIPSQQRMFSSTKDIIDCESQLHLANSISCCPPHCPTFWTEASVG